MHAPERLAKKHDVSTFESGSDVLDEWLRSRALLSEGLSARTYVISPDDQMRVVGYYALSTALAQRATLPTAKLRQGMPEDIPLLLVGRLAVDAEFHGKGLGTDLLRDALRRCLAVSEIAGVRAVVTHAIDDEAVAFYLHHSFLRSPLGERVMIMPIEKVRVFVGA